jgi:hypothetical protein
MLTLLPPAALSRVAIAIRKLISLPIFLLVVLLEFLQLISLIRTCHNFVTALSRLKFYRFFLWIILLARAWLFVSAICLIYY